MLDHSFDVEIEAEAERPERPKASHRHLLRNGWPWSGPATVSAALIHLACLPAQAEPDFENQSAALPHPHVYAGGWDHFVGGGVAVADCNGDLRPDIVVAGGTNPASLFVNTSAPGGDLRFATAPFPAFQGMTGAYPLHLDEDGHIDLVILRNGPNALLRGTGDCRFEDATDSYGLARGDSWTTAFSATWETGQTLPTLAFGNYVDADDPEGPFGACDSNALYRPTGDSYGAPLALEPAFCTLSMLFSDWRRDGQAMLRISNDRHYYLHDGREQMWTLQPLAELGEDEGWSAPKLWGMGIASRDLNGDGLPEVMLTSMGDQMLMANDGTGFETVPWETGTFAHRPFVGDDGRPSTGWHAEFADVDNDGRSDLFIAKGNVDQMPSMAMSDPNNLLMQQADGSFREHGATAGIATVDRSRGATFADLNGDGLLDLLVVNRRAPMEVWQNVTTDAGNWLAIDPLQSGPNRAAIGGFVEVRVTGVVQTHELTVGGGHVSGSRVPAHFGLGTAEEAEVRVIWPDGEDTDWQQLAAGQVYQITRPRD